MLSVYGAFAWPRTLTLSLHKVWNLELVYDPPIVKIILDWWVDMISCNIWDDPLGKS